ncbi:hypothetical protein [Acinetobacter seifertii]|uniref:hypothetical protein n=1 Tax=Acinetobacter seifertii TaxID=1530123 RepID=UPI00124EBB47|nr:hypothetical protein [Acinetobacter seifertii]
MNYLAHLVIAVIVGFVVAFIIHFLTGDHQLAKTAIFIIIMIFPVHARLYDIERKLKRLGLKL